MVRFSVLFFSLNWIWISCDALEIQVSQVEGQDSTSCLNRGSKCRTLQFALQGLDTKYLGNDTELKILMMDNLYFMDQRITILQPRPEISLSIEGKCQGCRIMSFQCIDPIAGITVGDQFAQRMAQNIQFINLQFKNCGPNLASAVIIWNSLNISFFDCSFINNLQAAINGMDSTVTIQRCTFTNNTCNRNVLNETSGKPPFVSGRISQGAGTGFHFTNSTNLTVVIRDSYFLNNTAVEHNDSYYVSPASNVSNFGEGGGAISIVFFKTTKNCKAILDNLNLTGNTATYGGGIYLVESGQSHGNALFINRSVIRRNRAGQAGGGICTSQWDESRRSSILIENCTIEENNAPRGGGLNAFFMSIEGLLDSKMKLKQVIARRNAAPSAPAFRFTSSLPYGDVPGSVIEMVDCVISEHITGPHNIHSYLAPVTVQRLKICVSGVNEIKHNHGAGGMVVEHGVLHVQGILNFTSNTGSSGGGLRIWSGQIKLYPLSELIFHDNHVSTIGGALSVQLFPNYEVIHMYNTDCFLTYSESLTPPSKWKTKVVFTRNSAKLKGAAIFVTSLSSCLWDEESPHYSVNRSLRWVNTKFIYEGNYMKVDGEIGRLHGPQYDIATDTAKIVHTYPEEITNLELFPGENMKLHLQGRDELDHNVYTIANVIMTSNVRNHSYELTVPNTLNVLDAFTHNTLGFMYYANGTKAYSDMLGTSHKISVTGVYSSINFNYSFNLRTVACSPGYIFKETKCVCNTSIPGVLRCDGERTVYLKDGYWAGLSEENILITYYCPFKYCKCKKAPNNANGCILDTKNFTSQCATGREGFLCGRCAKGLSVGIRMNECLDCHDGGWILFVVFVIVVALCILVIYLNPSMSKDLRGPLFFFQMLPFMFRPSDEVGEVVKLFAYMFEFGGPIVYIWKTCIANGITNLYAMLVGYMMPLTTLLIFLVAYILSSKRVIRTKLRKTSNLKSFWLIILFMYKYLVETTLLILHCPFIDGKMRFFYDGNIECFHGQHLFMAVIALLVLVTLVISPPVIIILLTKGYWKVDPQYLSTLTEGLRAHCLWWWAVDFARRILIVGTFVFIPDWKTKQIWMMIMTLFVFAVHSNVQPYKRIYTNVTEAIYLFVLCVLAIVQIMEDQDRRSDVSGTLLVMATIHSVTVCAVKFWRFCQKRCHNPFPKKVRSPHYGSFEDISQNESVRSSVETEARTKRQNLFDSIFASSGDASNNNSSTERF